MLFRNTVFALALVGSAIPAAFASSDALWLGSNQGFVAYPGNSNRLYGVSLLQATATATTYGGTGI